MSFTAIYGYAADFSKSLHCCPINFPSCIWGRERAFALSRPQAPTLSRLRLTATPRCRVSGADACGIVCRDGLACRKTRFPPGEAHPADTAARGRAPETGSRNLAHKHTESSGRQKSCPRHTESGKRDGHGKGKRAIGPLPLPEIYRTAVILEWERIRSINGWWCPPGRIFCRVSGSSRR